MYTINQRYPCSIQKNVSKKEFELLISMKKTAEILSADILRTMWINNQYYYFYTCENNLCVMKIINVEVFSIHDIDYNKLKKVYPDCVSDFELAIELKKKLAPSLHYLEYEIEELIDLNELFLNNNLNELEISSIN
jgi:hypothetical protein